MSQRHVIDGLRQFTDADVKAAAALLKSLDWDADAVVELVRSTHELRMLLAFVKNEDP